MTGQMHALPVPPGWRYTLVLVAMTKRALAYDMDPAMQLRLLEGLKKCEGCGVTAAAIAAVEPFDEVSAKIASAADNNLDALGSEPVFDVLAQQNASLVAALRLCGHGGQY